jgi:hypothetical protein
MSFKEFKEFKERSQEPEFRSQEANRRGAWSTNGRTSASSVEPAKNSARLKTDAVSGFEVGHP